MEINDSDKDKQFIVFCFFLFFLAISDIQKYIYLY